MSNETRNFDAELDALEPPVQLRPPRPIGTDTARRVSATHARLLLVVDVLTATAISIAIFVMGIAVSSAYMQ